ncbi:MAG: hypothetical protein J5659_05010 [Clostridia bacterium]|nr:hypothetical protein [Clostridia bacterium]
MKANRKWRSLISVLLCAVLLLSVFSITAFADWQDGQECWLCGHWHYDDYMCGMCGACSDDCSNASCHYDTHCRYCGACLQDVVWCDECHLCEDCYLSNGFHCPECEYTCWCENNEELCGNCWRCPDCAFVCPDCGWCEDCIESENMHCAECGNCYTFCEPCQDGGDHCVDCCVICPQCDGCLFDDGLEICEFCELCTDCCLANAENEGCDCGEYCIESGDWMEHICEECATPFCQVDQCEICGLCLECCQSNSDCSEGMCVEDPDYEEHFCADCGQCFHDVDVCDTCMESGNLRCEDCCRELVQAEGCYCGDRCISDDDFEAHIAAAHSGSVGGPHSAKPYSAWSVDANYHWHDCRLCDSQSHITGKSAHTFNVYGVCTVCRYNSKNAVVIVKQPKSKSYPVTDVHDSGYEDELSPAQNYAVFTTAAKGSGKLSYQWYQRVNEGTWKPLKDNKESWYGYPDYIDVKGAKTGTLQISVPADACTVNYTYKCVVTDAKGNSTETNIVALRGKHAYNKAVAVSVEDHGSLTVNGKTVKYQTSPGHKYYCVGEECEHQKSKTAAVHIYGPVSYITDSKTGISFAKRTCRECGFNKYTKQHDHYYYDDSGECTVDLTYKNKAQHRLKCLFDDCGATMLETHSWSPWQIVASPYGGSNKGAAYKECRVCGYTYEKQYYTYDKNSDPKIAKADWTQDTDLVSVLYGTASLDILPKQSNDIPIVLVFSPSGYDKSNSIEKQSPLCTGWKVYYKYLDNPSLGENDITDYVTINKASGINRWNCSVPFLYQRHGGGIIIFEPIISNTECKHTGAKTIEGQRSPVCVKDGYTGDTVCCDCGSVTTYGEPIPGGTSHTGTLTYVEGTAVVGDCQHKGYEGDYLCSECGMHIKGKKTPKKHGTLKEGTAKLKNVKIATSDREGYSGDLYCLICGELIREGKVIDPSYIEISKIKLTGVTAPKEGKTPTYASGVRFEGDGADGLSFHSFDWYDETDENTVKSTDKFVAGHKYSVIIGVKAKLGYEFAVNSSWKPLVSATVNSYNANITKAYEQDPREVVLVKYNFGECSESVIKQIYINDITAPVPGEYPDYSFSFGNGGYGLTYPEGVTYASTPFRWVDRTDGGTTVYPTDKFIAGHNYAVEFQLTPDSGYSFDISGTNLSVLHINGNSVPNENHHIVGGTSFLTFFYTFYWEPVNVDNVKILGITAPASGRKPDYTATLGNPALYSFDPNYGVNKCGFYWYDVETGEIMDENDTFVEGKEYQLDIKLAQNMQDKLVVSTFGNKVVVSINGKDITNDQNAFLGRANQGRNYIVYYTYVAEKFVCEHKKTEVKGTKAATCDAVGYTGDTVCSVCGDVVETGHSIPALGHIYEWVITKEATQNEPGLKEEICTMCGHKSGASEAIEYQPHIPGDINGDGKVNNKDLTRLFQYLSGWNVTVNGEALDVNGDGNENNQDIARLFQYLSGWNVKVF